MIRYVTGTYKGPLEGEDEGDLRVWHLHPSTGQLFYCPIVKTVEEALLVWAAILQYDHFYYGEETYGGGVEEWIQGRWQPKPMWSGEEHYAGLSVPDGWAKTGEHRWPEEGERWLTKDGQVSEEGSEFHGRPSKALFDGKRFILEPVRKQERA